jgi:hypothetical protein
MTTPLAVEKRRMFAIVVGVTEKKNWTQDANTIFKIVKPNRLI